MVLGVASGWPTRKGLEDMCRLRVRLPDHWRIVLVGLTVGQKKNLPAGIEGITEVSSVDQLARLYAEAAVFVNPTYIDNFPTTNLEALACGTPVVTYETGGSPESLNRMVGAVVPKGDEKALAHAVKAWGEAGISGNVRSHCRAHAVQNFGAVERFEDHVTAYEDLLGA